MKDCDIFYNFITVAFMKHATLPKADLIIFQTVDRSVTLTQMKRECIRSKALKMVLDIKCN